MVDKAAGWTSHDVVAKARGILGTRKVGHSGTLDPDATGVLLLGVGKVTRLLRYLGLPDQDLHGRDRARHRDLDAGRLRRGDRHLGHERGGRRRRAGRRDHAHRRHPPGPADGVGHPGGRTPSARARPGGHRDRAGRRDPSPSTASRSVRRSSRDASPSRSSARRAPTSARSPTTSAGRWVGERTSATSAGRPSARSRWTWPWRSTRWTRLGCSRRRRRCATSRR